MIETQKHNDKQFADTKLLGDTGFERPKVPNKLKNMGLLYSALLRGEKKNFKMEIININYKSKNDLNSNFFNIHE